VSRVLCADSLTVRTLVQMIIDVADTGAGTGLGFSV
jgi:hypothetical protein